MSDLIYLFGNNGDDLISSNSNTFSKNFDISKKENIRRPNTLITRKESFKNSWTQKALNSPQNSNGFYKNQSKYPLTPANVSFKLFNKIYNNSTTLHNSLTFSNLLNLPNELPPENADGNIEYKRQLLNLTPLRLQHLITQLKWRLAEGEGEAIYEIGVDDDGKVAGLEELELIESVQNLCKMAESLNASVSLVRECIIGSRKALEILIRKLPTHFSTRETRVAVLGNMDAGKSTLIGVLTQGILDNGNGKTRLTTFRHVHEVRSGRTSSISCQLLGFDRNEKPSNFYWQKSRLHQRSHEEVVLSSARLVVLIDLAGCHKYQRTTLFGLTARRPHLVLLVVPATHGLKATAVEHCQYALALGLPIAIVITKIDRTSPDDALNQLRTWVGARRPSCQVTVVTGVTGAKQAAVEMSGCGSIPVFPVSCVSGMGIDVLTAFLGTLQITDELHKHLRSEIWIDQVHFEVPRVDGCVVGGLVYTGLVQETDCLYLGPQKDGNFVPVIVHSIHRNRVQQTTVENGQYASFAVSVTSVSVDSFEARDESQLQWLSSSPNTPVDEWPHVVGRGMVLLGSVPSTSSTQYTFSRVAADDGTLLGQVVWGLVVAHSRTLDDRIVSADELLAHQGHWVVHCGNVYEKCKMLPFSALSLDMATAGGKDISTNDIIFRFQSSPQWVHYNYPVVFHRPGQSIKAWGRIKLLLGSGAFPSPFGQLENETRRVQLLSTNCHRKRNRKSSPDEDCSDEYVTAPSSPIIS